MNVNDVVIEIPEDPSLIRPGVLYYGEYHYPIDGRYSFHLVGKAKFGSHTIVTGNYQGNGSHLLTVNSGSAVVFDRYPSPKPPIISPHPVADVPAVDPVERRMRAMFELLDQRSTPADHDSPDLSALFDDEDDDLDDLYISELGIVDETTMEATESPSDEAKEPEPTPVVGEAEKAPHTEAEGVQGGSPASA